MAPGQRGAEWGWLGPERRSGSTQLSGSVAFEGEDGAPVGAAVGVPDGGVGRVWVVGDEGVEAVVVALGCVDGLGAADLFCGFAKDGDGALEVVAVNGRLGGEDTGEGGDAEGGVGVGVARCPGVEVLAGGFVGDGLLGVAGDGVVLGVGTEDGAAGAVGGEEGGGHLAGAALDVEALGLQEVAEGVGGAVFAPGGFGVVPDLAVEVGEGLLVVVDPLEGVGFFGRGVGHGGVSFLGLGGTRDGEVVYR